MRIADMVFPLPLEGEGSYPLSHSTQIIHSFTPHRLVSGFFHTQITTTGRNQTVDNMTTANGPADAPAAGTETTPTDNTQAEQQTTAPAAEKGLPTDVATLHSMIAELRKENGAARVNAKAQAAAEARETLIQDMGRALGLITDNDATPDAETLTAQLAAERETARTAQTHLAVYRAANAAGVDPDQLLDSVSFLNSIKATDPTDGEAVAAAVTAWAQARPKTTPAQAVGTNTVEHAAGSGEPTTPRTLEGAIARAYAR